MNKIQTFLEKFAAGDIDESQKEQFYSKLNVFEKAELNRITRAH